MKLKSLVMKVTLITGLLGVFFPQIVKAEMNAELETLKINETEAHSFNPMISIVDKTFVQESIEGGGRCPACSRCEDKEIIGEIL